MSACRKCGCCCRRLITEVNILDILREPLLLGHIELPDIDILEIDDDEKFVLACGLSKLCPFLVNNECKIYPTRPNVCVSLQPDDEQCKMSREVMSRKII